MITGIKNNTCFLCNMYSDYNRHIDNEGEELCVCDKCVKDDENLQYDSLSDYDSDSDSDLLVLLY